MLGQAAVIIVNPSLWNLYAYPFATIGDPMYMMNVREWIPPALDEQPGFFALLAATSLVLAFTVRSWTLPDLLVSAAFLWLALTARRHIPLFCIAAIPPLARAATTLAGSIAARVRVRPAAAALLGLAVMAAFPAAMAFSGKALRFGVRDDLYPADGMKALSGMFARAAPGKAVRVFTLHRWGGYLEWHLPSRFKVFIDGRQLVYGPVLFADYCRILENTEEAGGLIKRYEPDVFLIDYGSKLGSRLARSREAALVYWTIRASSTCGGARPIQGSSARGIPRLQPGGPRRGSGQAVVRELERAAREAPRHGRPWTNLASLQLAEGRTGEAWASVQAALSRAPGVLPPLLTAAAVAAARGDFTAAERFVARARAANPASPAPFLAGARASLAAGRTAEADRRLREAVRAGNDCRRRPAGPTRRSRKPISCWRPGPVRRA